MAEVERVGSRVESRRSSWRFAARITAVPALVGCLAVGSLASADEKPATGARAGVLVLPNVQVRTATPEQMKRAAGGVVDQGRAYKDQDTGQLRMPTPEELIEASFEPEVASPPVQVRTLPDGTRVAALGDGAMAHSVVRRNLDGTLQKACVAGSTAATKAISTPVTQERRDDER